MRKLLNTLFVFTEDAYLRLDGENVVVSRDGQELGRMPLHRLESVLCFSYRGASPKLMHACVERGINLAFFDSHGRFLARAQGLERGNVHLRTSQYEWARDEARSLGVARNLITGKLYNSRRVLERACRDHGLRIDREAVKRASESLKSSLLSAQECDSLDSLRGIEGDAAAEYFGVFDELILRNKDPFAFHGRNRRPPRDSVNAMLSLFYTVLMGECVAALEGAGLDVYVGFMHAERPGRKSLALDMMEELRAVLVDRFVLACINNRVIGPDDFEHRESGEVLLTDKGRRTLFQAWHVRSSEKITHPYLKEKVPWGLVPHAQALLLARHLRGDLDAYPAFLWK